MEPGSGGARSPARSLVLHKAGEPPRGCVLDQPGYSVEGELSGQRQEAGWRKAIS